MNEEFIEFEDSEYISDKFSVYRQWNNCIFKYYFTGKFNNKPVRLDINDDIVRIIANNLKFSPNEFEERFISVIKNSVIFSNGFRPIYEISKKWSRLNEENHIITPPFICILSFFSFIAEGMVRDKDFASSNYYGRLKNTLEIEDQSIMQRSFMKFDDVWQMLNRWLAEWENELGIPTAYALDSRIHVSIPMSQALIRDQDRHNLKLMFDHEELSPGQEVNHNEMEIIIREWYQERNPGHILKLLKNTQTKNALLNAACEELMLWDGITDPIHKSQTEETKNKSNRLFYLAKWDSYPENKIILNLCGFQNKGSLGDFKIVTNGMSKDKKEIFLNFNDKLEFQEYKNFVRLSSDPPFSHGDALTASLNFKSNNDGTQLSRNKKIITILAEDQELGKNYFKEVSGIQYGRNNILIVWHTMKEKIDAFLKRTAKTGYEIYIPQKNNDNLDNCLINLPENFIVFKDVQILNAVEADGLEDLYPISSSNSNVTINITEGLYLLNNTWHSKHPPEIEIISAKPLNIEIIDLYENKVFTSSLNNNVTTINLKKLNISSGDYSILIDGRKERRFKIRKGNDSKINKFITEITGHHLNKNSPLNSITATKSSINSGDNLVVGNHCICESISQSNYKRQPIANSTINLQVAMEKYEEKINENTATKFMGLGEDLFDHGDKIYCTNKNDKSFGITGVFSGIFDSGENYPGDRCFKITYQRPLTATQVKHEENPEEILIRNIEDLKHFKLADDEHVEIGSIGKKKSFKSRVQRFKELSQNASIEQKQITIDNTKFSIKKRDSRSISLNDIFDGLCYLKEGSFETFCNIIDAFDESLGAKFNLIKQLSSLGHIDIIYDLEKLRPKSWRVSNPCIFPVGENKFILSGWRTEEFIDSIQNACNQIGGRIVKETNENMIDSIFVYDIENNDLNDFARIISDESNFPLEASENPANTLLTLLPSLSKIKDSLSKVACAENDLDMATIINGRIIFKPASGELKKGAYRLKLFGSRYFFLTQDLSVSNEAIRCDVKLAKYLAFKDLHDQWFAYNPDSQDLIVPKDMELPFLFERIAVSQSGFKPTVSENNLIYRNIPKQIAEGIAFKLFA